MEHENQNTTPRHEPCSNPLQLKRTQLNALKKLKEILRSSGISDSDKMWGIPLLGGGDSPDRADVVLLKFLHAERFKVTNSLKLLHKCLAWRKQFKADTILEEEYEYKKHKLGELLRDFAYVQGYDREERPVCYVAYGGIKDNIRCGSIIGSKQHDPKDVVKKFVRWRIQLLERTIRQHLDFKPCGGVDSITEVHDLKDLPLHMYLIFEGCNRFNTLVAHYYPWIASNKIYINAPWYSILASILVYPCLIESDKKNGWSISKKGKATETLFRFIPPHHVPVQYSGLSHSTDQEQNGALKPAEEVIVSGFQALEIEIKDIPCGVTTNWEITVAGWEVEYSVKFIPSVHVGHRAITLQEPMRLKSSWKKVIRETFTWPEAGMLVLRVDNSRSEKNKVVAYRHSFDNAKSSEGEVSAYQHSFLTE